MSSSANETQFESILIQLKVPYLREYVFSKRKWPFDFAIPEKKLAFEIEGGVWAKGRHQTAIGFMNDCHKYLQANLDGWFVFRIPAPWLFHTNRQKTYPYLMTYDQVKTRVKKLYNSRPDVSP